MWWWQFDREEPLQEDLVIYEKFIEIQQDRDRMNKDKAAQKERAKKGTSARHATYNIPDPQP